MGPQPYTCCLLRVGLREQLRVQVRVPPEGQDRRLSPRGPLAFVLYLLSLSGHGAWASWAEGQTPRWGL